MRVYACGDQVLYGVHGVCSILALEERIIDRKKVEYYVLAPVEQGGSRFYVPTGNAAAVAKMRPVMSREQIDALLSSDAADADAWITDEGQRKQRYRELICSADSAALLDMVRSLYRHKAEQTAAGRKFHLCDENFLRDAEKILESEFSIVMGLSPSEVSALIKRSV